METNMENDMDALIRKTGFIRIYIYMYIHKVTHYGPHIYSTPGLSSFGKVNDPPTYDYHYTLCTLYMYIYISLHKMRSK